MRKIFTFLTLIFTLLISINNTFTMCEAKVMNNFSVSYESDVYEPFDEYFSETIKGTVNINYGTSKSNLRLRYELYSPIKYGYNKYYASGFVGARFSYPETKSISYSFRLSDPDNNAQCGILIRFGIYDRDSKTYINYIESNITTKKDNDIILDDISGDLVFDTCLCLSEKDVKETFNFSNYGSILEIDNYYRLELSPFSLYYKSFKEFSCDSAELMIRDNENDFPYLDIGEGNNKRVPIYPLVNNDWVSFEFKNLYVNSKTLEMSNDYQEGFTKTNYFYLPKNKLNRLQGREITMRVSNAGVNNISFNHQAIINIDSRLIGPCNESSYCIIGGVKE